MKFDDEVQRLEFYLKDCEEENKKLREKLEKYKKALTEIANEGHPYLGEVARFCVNTARESLGKEKLK